MRKLRLNGYILTAALALPLPVSAQAKDSLWRDYPAAMVAWLGAGVGALALAPFEVYYLAQEPEPPRAMVAADLLVGIYDIFLGGGALAFLASYPPVFGQSPAYHKFPGVTAVSVATLALGLWYLGHGLQGVTRVYNRCRGPTCIDPKARRRRASTLSRLSFAPQITLGARGDQEYLATVGAAF